MSSEPTDFTMSKRDRQHIQTTVVHLAARVQVLDETVVDLAEQIADLQTRVEHHHVRGQMSMLPARVTPKQRDALAYMAAHADLKLSPTGWQENGGFGGSVLPKLVEHGLVDRVAGNRYRVNQQGIDYLAQAAS